MKKMMGLFSLVLTLLLVPSIIVKADNDVFYINSQGVEFDENNYHYLTGVLGTRYVEYMTQDEYNALENQTLTLVSEQSIIVDTIETNGIPMDMISPQAVSGNPGGYRTTSKQLGLLVYSLNTNLYYATASNEWLRMPVVRVFDIFAIRVDSGFSVVDGSQQGTQFYSGPSVQDAITYQYNGTNTMRFSNGFGMSMNLVDNTSIDTLINTITCRLNGNQGDVQATYEHAVDRSVTRAQSMDYFLNVNGMGGSIMFNNSSMWNKYDGMMGVYARINR